MLYVLILTLMVAAHNHQDRIIKSLLRQKVTREGITTLLRVARQMVQQIKNKSSEDKTATHLWISSPSSYTDSI